jgi:hypothetical protein
MLAAGSALASFSLLWILKQSDRSVISHHAGPPPPGGIKIPYAPDISCGGPPSGKPAFNFTINGVLVGAELDSGASSALLRPGTAARVKLTSLPNGPTQGVAFTGQAATTLQGYNTTISLPGIPPVPITIFTGPTIGCDVIPTQIFTKTYTVALSSTSASFIPGVAAV